MESFSEVAYIDFFNSILFCVLLLTLPFCFLGNPERDKVTRLLFYVMSVVLFVYSVYYIGSREAGIGIDTGNYRYRFEYSDVWDGMSGGTFLYNLISDLMSRVVSFDVFLYVMALLYVGFALLACWRFFGPNVFFPFILFLATPYFFQFGINVMRNGIAASIFLFALSLDMAKGRRRYLFFLFAFISVGFHLSMLIPLVSYLFVSVFKRWINIQYLVLGVLLFGSFLLALLPMPVAEPILFNLLSPFSEKASSYFMNLTEDSSAIFNYFLYLFWSVVVGGYYVYLRKVKDFSYMRLLCIYMLGNVLYFLCIRVFYSLRFAYLFGFLLPVIFFYPLFKFEKNWKLRNVSVVVFLLLMLGVKIVKTRLQYGVSVFGGFGI